jgi:hypothetical protein
MSVKAALFKTHSSSLKTPQAFLNNDQATGNYTHFLKYNVGGAC